MENVETYLARWRTAGLIDEGTATAIRSFEASQGKPRSRQWQVLLALVLGGILLCAGVLLFVASHWDTVSPLVRMSLVLSMLVFFHGLGILTRECFSGFATAMHALGTVSSGAAIALIGQIFNMQEHWPAAVLLWALCAAAGWLLLRDSFQQTLTLLLFPAWIASEFCYRLSPYAGSIVYLARIIVVLAAVYLAAFLKSRQREVFGILFGVGALMLPIAIGSLMLNGWRVVYSFGDWGFVPLSWRIVTGLFVLAIAAASILAEKRSSIPIALAILLGYALPWAQSPVKNYGQGYIYWEANLLAYALLAFASITLIWWGVHIVSKALVNYGVAGFALTVLCFYFSSIMDKLDRSLGLIFLGILFLAGGWIVERTRRRLVSSMNRGEA